MFIHPLANGPAIFKLGPINLPFYGMMYLLSYLIGDYLGRQRIQANGGLNENEFDELYTYLLLGVFMGGRLGDIFFYRLHYFATSPWLFMEHRATGYNVWISLGLTSAGYLYSKYFMEKPLTLLLFTIPLVTLFTGDAGMSFHGALLGGLLSILLYSYNFNKHFLDIVDFITPLIPPGLGLGRLANFINGELWGRPTNAPWGVIFPRADTLARHPSQLYECFLEGLLLFTLVWQFSKRPRPRGATFGLAIFLYALIRIIVEFFREPDHYTGFIIGDWMTMGQLLSIPMLIVGPILLANAYSKIPRHFK